MRVLFIARHFYPHVGGVEKHTQKISEKLKNNNINVTIICEGETESDQKLPDRQSPGHISNCYRISYPKTKIVGLLVIWWKLWNFRNLIKSSDLVHCHDVFIWYLPFRFLFPKIPVYSTFHGWEGIYPIPRKYKLIRQISAKLSKGVICVGKYIEKYYQISADKIIYGAVDDNKNTPLPKKNSKRILYLGRLDPDTGIKTYIRAFRILKNKNPELKFEFVGDGIFKSDAQELGTVYGFQTNTHPFIEDARFVCTSGYLSMLEGLAAKRVVFSVSENEIKFDILKMSPFESLTIHSINPEALAKKIEFFLKSPIQEQRMIDKGYKWAKLQTWDNIAKIYIELWKN